METMIISPKRATKDAGEKISREYGDYLINGFKQKFPEETSFVFIRKETIIKAIKQLDDIVGIRFMYGFESVNEDGKKMLERVILLVPCNNVTQSQIPDFMLQPQGYLTSNGESVDFEKSKMVLYNHSVRFSKYFPGVEFNKIMRGAFMGINTLQSILETEGCAGINFNLGYDEAIAEVPYRNKPVIEVVDSFGNWLEVFDQMPPCPPIC